MIKAHYDRKKIGCSRREALKQSVVKTQVLCMCMKGFKKVLDLDWVQLSKQKNFPKKVFRYKHIDSLWQLKTKRGNKLK